VGRPLSQPAAGQPPGDFVKVGTAVAEDDSPSRTAFAAGEGDRLAEELGDVGGEVGGLPAAEADQARGRAGALVEGLVPVEAGVVPCLQ
jgi:hypothetical protein